MAEGAETILVVGATGRTGGEVVRLLAEGPAGLVLILGLTRDLVGGERSVDRREGVRVRAGRHGLRFPRPVTAPQAGGGPASIAA